MKKYISEIQTIAFCGLITFIFLTISLEFLEWSIQFSFWEGTLGVSYTTLNLFEKLTVWWILGIPLYSIKKYLIGIKRTNI
jgi:multidrug transporter EmrE-like cation transporter